MADWEISSFFFYVFFFASLFGLKFLCLRHCLVSTFMMFMRWFSISLSLAIAIWPCLRISVAKKKNIELMKFMQQLVLLVSLCFWWCCCCCSSFFIFFSSCDVKKMYKKRKTRQEIPGQIFMSIKTFCEAFFFSYQKSHFILEEGKRKKRQKQQNSFLRT